MMSLASKMVKICFRWVKHLTGLSDVFSAVENNGGLMRDGSLQNLFDFPIMTWPSAMY